MPVYSATTEGEETLTTSAETLIALISATTVKPKLIEWGVAFSGTSATAEPIRVRLIRATADGTGTGAAEEPWDPDNPTANATAKHSYTAEPTKASTPLGEWLVHPQSGMVMQYPLGREPTLDNATTSILCIEVLAPAATDAVAYIVWEE